MAFTCQQDGVIDVISGGINWNNMVWNGIIFTPGNPSAGSGGGLGTGNQYSIFAQGGPPALNGGASNPDTLLTGSMTYNGPQVDCHIVLAEFDTGSGAAVTQIIIKQDGGDLFNAIQPVDDDYLFTVLDTGGLDSVLFVSVEVVGVTGDTSPPPVAPGGATLTGVLTPAS